MQYRKGFFRGRHADLCDAIAAGTGDSGLHYIYRYFRGTDHNDTYSIEILTIVRELLEDDDSQTLSRLRLRMRKSGDKVLINLVQFMYAFGWSEYHKEAAVLILDKIRSEMPAFVKSVRNFIEEEAPQGIEMAGLRIRDSLSLLVLYCLEHDLAENVPSILSQNLELTRLMLSGYSNFVTEDMMKVASDAWKRGEKSEALPLLRSMVGDYGDVSEMLENQSEISKEIRETCENLLKAYELLDEIEHDPKDAASAQNLRSLLER